MGVILSAGKGSRIDPFNTQYPKPLLPVGNVPILGHHLERFKSLGIRHAKIVVGHLMDHIINYYGRGDEVGLAIQYIEQEHTLGIAHAVGKVEPHVDGPILLCLGDIFYLTSGIERLVTRFARGDVAGVLAVMDEPDPASMKKNFSVELDGNGFVRRVVEKPREPRSRLKGCGIYLFGPQIFDAIRKTPRTALRDEYEITTSIQLLVDDGHKIAVESVIDWDLNVTFPKDLLTGNIHYLEHLGRDSIVDPSARVHPDARITRTVVGKNVVIDSPIALDECVILPGSRITGSEGLRRTIVSRDIVIRC